MGLNTNIEYKLKASKSGELLEEYTNTYLRFLGITNKLKDEKLNWEDVEDTREVTSSYGHLLKQKLPSEFDPIVEELQKRNNIKSLKRAVVEFEDEAGSLRSSYVYSVETKNGAQFYLEKTTSGNMNKEMGNYDPMKIIFHDTVNTRKYYTHTNMSPEDYKNSQIENITIDDHFAPYMHQLNALIAYGNKLGKSDEIGGGLVLFATGTGKTFIMGHTSKAIGEGITLVPNDIDAEKVKLDYEENIMKQEFCALGKDCRPGQEENFLKRNPHVILTHGDIKRFSPYMEGRNVFADEAQLIPPQTLKDLKEKTNLMAVTATPTKEILDLFAGELVCQVTLYRAMLMNAFRPIKTDAYQLEGDKNIESQKNIFLEQSIIKYFSDFGEDNKGNTIKFSDHKLMIFHRDSQFVDHAAKGYQALFEGKLDDILGSGATERITNAIQQQRGTNTPLDLREEAREALKKNVALNLERNTIAELLGQGKKSIRKHQVADTLRTHISELEDEYKKYQTHGGENINPESKRIFEDLGKGKEQSMIIQKISEHLKDCPNKDKRIENVLGGNFSTLFFTASEIDLDNAYKDARYATSQKAGEINKGEVDSFKYKGYPIILANDYMLETGFDDPDLLSVHRFVSDLHADAPIRSVQMLGRNIRAKDGLASSTDFISPELNIKGELGVDRPLLFSDLIGDNFVHLVQEYLDAVSKNHKISPPPVDVEVNLEKVVSPDSNQKLGK